MIGEAIRPELATALTRAAGIKTMPGLDVGQQLVPVMIIEDVSKGPFPPSRIWHAGVLVAASAGNVMHWGIANKDKPGAGSSCTVDYIIARPTGVDDLAIAIGQYSGTAFPAEVLVKDGSNESGGLPTGSAADPQLGNVVSSIFPNPVGLNGVVVPWGDTQPRRIDGPWTLGPGGALFIRCITVNVGLSVFAKGRYHAGV